MGSDDLLLRRASLMLFKLKRRCQLFEVRHGRVLPSSEGSIIYRDPSTTNSGPHRHHHHTYLGRDLVQCVAWIVDRRPKVVQVWAGPKSPETSDQWGRR